MLFNARLPGWVESQQVGELLNPKVRVPNDSPEKGFLYRPARMNGYYGSSLPARVNQDEVASLLPILNESRPFQSSDHLPRTEGRKLRHSRRE